MNKRLNSRIILFVVFLVEGLQVCFCGNSSFGCIEEERQALLKLKQSFHDPWNQLVSWSGQHCCEWKGVSCNTDTGHVVKLDLRTDPSYPDFEDWDLDYTSYSFFQFRFDNTSKQLSASQVNSCLVELKHLEYLDLSGNYFNGSKIPDFFGLLTNLKYLNISHAGFGGMIPRQLGNLTNLKLLDLSVDVFSEDSTLRSDTIQWASSLLSLEHLDMSGVDLSEAIDLIQTFNKLPFLVNLQLKSCRIQNIHFTQHDYSVNSTFLERIQFLGLQGNNLRGEIPNVVHNMTGLRKLDLSDQRGILYPESMGWVSRLSSLQELDMSGVNFNMSLDLMKVLSSIPSLLRLSLNNGCLQNIHFSDLTVNATLFASLQYLSLYSNMLSGPIPSVLQNMTQLRQVYLSSNRLNSTVPLWLVHSKTLVDISKNEFDNIEGGLFTVLNNACSLKILSLSYNPFRNEIIFGSTRNLSGCLSYSLESLYLSYTEATGSIPNWIGQLQSLKKLDLRSNSFFGPIPSSITKLSFLTKLDISYNQLTGVIPQSLGKLSSLETLYLSENQLSESIPKSIGNLSRLRYLSLSHNQLDGIIPKTLGRLSTLISLRISHNRFTGLPYSIGKLENINYLDISFNPLKVVTLDNPSSLSELVNMSNWTNLYLVNISSCGIGDEFLQFLHTQNQIGEIDLSNNSISGDFHKWFNTKSLTYLDLSMNSISANSLAKILDAAPNLGILLLGSNRINRSLSNSLCKLKYLQGLDLSKNELTGNVPDCWDKLQMLEVVNLSSNKLSGKLGVSLGQLSYLKRLHVNNNTLEGEIPLALKSCTRLELLDLGENRFSGYIPTWIGQSLLSLQILRLRRNNLKGMIPPTICQLNKLKILDLAGNNLIGEIPQCFGKLSGMMIGGLYVTDLLKSTPSSSPFSVEPWKREEVLLNTKGLALEYTRTTLELLDLMDLSSNKLVGVIPDELCLLSGLRGLNLSHNHLSGNIPHKIGDMRLLETLDLSSNQLFGAIPNSVTALPSISHLNFSNNNLSGKIPTSNQLQTLTDPSIYSGNIHLCGDPLPKCQSDDDSIKIPSYVDETRDHEDDKNDGIWFWFIVIIGYATGLWAVIGTLVFKQNWRIAYFRFLENTKERMLVSIPVEVTRLMKKMMKSSEEKLTQAT